MAKLERATVPDEAADILHFTVPSGDAGRKRLHTVLRAHMAHRSARTLRRFLVHVLAGLGTVVVLCVLASGIASVQGYQSLIGVWSACLLSIVVTGAVEWRLRRHESRLIAEDDADAPWWADARER